MPLDLSFQPFSGAGIVTLHPYVAGKIGPGFDLGEVPAFDVTQTAPTAEMKTSREPSRGVAFRMAQSKSAGLSMTLKTLNDYTLGLLTSGVWTEVAASAAVADWVAPSDLVVGNVIRLPARNVSAVTIKDSTQGAAKTVDPANYELDPVAGTVTLKSLATGGPYVQPLKASYTPGAVKVLGALKAPETEFFVMLNGTNAYDGSRVIFEGYKFRFAAEGDSKWITEEFGEWKLNGGLLLDSSRSANSAGGQYYSLTKPGA
ncbi:UNVERIFIED_ORG: hypothetical protein LHJ69_14155 [Shinella sp. XGS7]|nr:hypothetical protein [Shinella sp. XGS7]